MATSIVLVFGALEIGCTEAEDPALSEQAEPRTVADLFPDAPGKPLVLDNCGVCHAVACTVIGQRPAARWAYLQDAHRQMASSLGEEDRQIVFGYLSSHFNDTTPEPRVPPRFLEQGCTPF